nr:MBL fold metallo-hydrolase [Propionibacterium sp.]
MDVSLTGFAPLGDRVWWARAEPASVTVGLVAGGTGCLVVDTGSCPSQGRAIRAAAEATAGVPVVAAVVTHHHYDHLFGLAAFADVATYGHRSIPGSVLRHAGLARELAEMGLSRADLARPGRAFRRRAALDLGGRPVGITHLGPAHTPGDSVVIVPDADLVFAGDLVEEAGPPSIELDTSLPGWLRALDRLLRRCGPATTVVPGHGRPVDRAFVAAQRAWLAAAAP